MISVGFSPIDFSFAILHIKKYQTNCKAILQPILYTHYFKFYLQPLNLFLAGMHAPEYVLYHMHGFSIGIIYLCC